MTKNKQSQLHQQQQKHQLEPDDLLNYQELQKRHNYINHTNSLGMPHFNGLQSKIIVPPITDHSSISKIIIFNPKLISLPSFLQTITPAITFTILANRAVSHRCFRSNNNRIKIMPDNNNNSRTAEFILQII